MKRMVFLILGILVILTWWLPAKPALAEPDLELGAKVFKTNCAGCHIGGKNALVANKNLGLSALHEYHMDSPSAIITQVTQGQSAMPAFGKQLKPNEIESVAAYVLDQAGKGWGKNLA